MPAALWVQRRLCQSTAATHPELHVQPLCYRLHVLFWKLLNGGWVSRKPCTFKNYFRQQLVCHCSLIATSPVQAIASTLGGLSLRDDCLH